jgi:hypothetical protein
MSSLSEADRALLLAMRAWADRGESPAATGGENGWAADLIQRFGDWLDPSLVQRLRDSGDRQLRDADAILPNRAIDRLRAMHQASARVELARVHPSWFVRALVEESPAVRRVVTASFPDSVRHRVQAELLLDSQDLIGERAAAPDVLGWVQALWTERLVGGEPERPDDPPVIRAMTRLPLPTCYALCRLAGVGKLALAGQNRGNSRPAPLHRARWEWLHGRLSTAGGDFQAAVRKDVQTVLSLKMPHRHRAARVGLVAFARLLAECEPFRVRWALQHWPYPIAKLTRSLIPAGAEGPRFLSLGESLILQTAWDRLNLEGRLPMSWPDLGREENGAV